ncbi:phosphatase PAP2 family protein [Halobaculum sp. P14]|uniref:phosphatase PAP2 family protein n=1 Tax=Halobaculum sp. P14 TaxID=3421638 RepID=UPI003EBE9EA6
MHGLGVPELVAGLPGWVVVVAAALTQLGDAWFIYLSFGLLYWLGDRRVAANPRRVGATLIAVAIGALAVTVGLKSLFALPRPPGASTAPAPTWLPTLLAVVFENAATGDGFGFPSGHAIAATMCYGGLATFLDVWDRRRRWTAAGAVIGVVGLTRLLLGVHHLLDVVAGVVAGAAALWLFGRVARSGFVPHPDRPFFLAGCLGVVAAAVAAAGGHGTELVEAGVAAGGGFGGYAVWRLRGTETAPVSRVDTAVGLGVVAALFVTAAFVASVGLPYVFGVVPDTPPYRLLAVVPLSFGAVALIVAWPTVVSRVRDVDADSDADAEPANDDGDSAADDAEQAGGDDAESGDVDADGDSDVNSDADGDSDDAESADGDEAER